LKEANLIGREGTDKIGLWKIIGQQ
jgi:hypothetical protein